jgi:type IV secretory pathway VirB10-like protein
MAEKKSEFVVTDRRRFGTEGEPRPDAQIAEEEKPSTKPAAPATPPAAKMTAPPLPPPPPPSQSAQTQAQPGPPATEQGEEMSPPPTAEEEHAQSEAYKASGKKIDDMISAAGKTPQGGPLEMSFERVIESFYMSALIQMGAIRQDNEPPRVDIIGARQTIDSLAILQEKTKGNLTDREKTLLQNVLFELRMAFIEITNVVATSATKPGAVPPGAMPPLDKK